MRVVIDTNVFISGIFWRGNFCSQIINAWKNKRFNLIISYSMLKEFEDTLRNFKIQVPENIIQEWKNIIIQNSIFIEPFEKIELIKDDPDDNRFLETALEGNADYVVSQDKHLLNLKEFRGIKIITPEEFLEDLNRINNL